MSCIWVSAQECSTNELFQLTELIRKEKDIQIIFSYEPPMLGPKNGVTEEKIRELLVRLGVRANLKGFQYLKTGVMMCVKDRDELDGITKRLYPSIARKHAATADKVEHAIRHAIESAWMTDFAEDQREIFGYDARHGKRPTNAEFISQVTDYVERMNCPMFS